MRMHHANPSNRYVLHTSLGGDLVYQTIRRQNRQADAQRSAERQRQGQSGCASSGFSPNKRFVYLVNELDASIYVLPWDARTVP